MYQLKMQFATLSTFGILAGRCRNVVLRERD